MKYKATVNMKNEPHKTCEIYAGDIKEAATEIRRKYPNRSGFEIKSQN